MKEAERLLERVRIPGASSRLKDYPTPCQAACGNV